MTGKEFTERIDSVLHGRNQTRKAITQDLGISSSTMSSWAAGRGSIPNVGVVAKIAEYLEVSIDWLVTGKEFKTELPPRDDLELARRIAALPPEYRELVMRQVEGFEGLCLRSQGEEKESGSA